MLWEHDKQALFPGQNRKDELLHYGVKGMHWGEITKEYQKVGYDHRYDHTQFKNKKANEIQKQIRRHNRQANLQNDEYRRRARKLGQNVGENFFYKARYKQRKDREEAYRKAHPKPDIVERKTKKVFDHFGLGEYSKQASDFMKDQAKNMALDHLKKNYLNKGPTTVKGSKAVGKILSKPVGLISKPIAAGANKMATAMDPKNVIKNGVKFTGKAAWKTAKFITVDTPKALHKGAKWLQNGGYSKIRSGYSKIRNGAHFIAKHARTAVGYLSRARSTASRLGSIGISKARIGIQAGATYAKNGAIFLANMLRKIKR